MKIIVAEDTEDARIILKTTLKSEGYDVRDASNGAEALKMAKEDPPDMIISDILMPEMDGFTLCKEIKKDRTLRRIPFIFYTATYTDPMDERLAMSLGASRFILKPMGNEDFLKIIEEVIIEHKEKKLNVPRMPLEDDAELHRMHDARLQSKLDKKIRDLEKERSSLFEKETALRASEEKYRRLIEMANDAIFVAEADSGTIIDANRQAENLLGIPVEKIIGMNQIHLHPPGDSKKYRAIFHQHMEKGNAIEADVEVINQSGERVPVEISASVVDIGGKKIIQGVFRDITKRKRAEEELQKHREHLEELVKVRTDDLEQTNKQLQNAIKELESFSYSISHDLKAPLRAISGFSNMLLEDYTEKLDEKGKHNLNVINDNVIRMGQLIDDILKYSRLSRQPLNRSEIDMTRLSEGVFLELQEGCAGRTVNFKVNTLPSCNADRVMIKQVLINLISNAIKFTRVREVAEIEVGSRQDENETVYYIKDNGIGFDIKYAEKPFDLFQSLHSTKDYEGTGVGLAIVQRLVHRHGGKVWAEGKVDEGATFSFTMGE